LLCLGVYTGQHGHADPPTRWQIIENYFEWAISATFRATVCITEL